MDEEREKTLLEIFEEFDSSEPLPENFSNEDLMEAIKSLGGNK